DGVRRPAQRIALLVVREQVADHRHLAIVGSEDETIAGGRRKQRVLQSFGEDVVAQRYVVVAVPNARDLVDRPTEGTMVDNDVLDRLVRRRFDLERITIGGRVSFGIVARSHAQMLDQYFRGEI